MSNHRLHDFVELGKKLFKAIGESPEKFVAMMDEMRRSTGAEIAAGDDFIVALRGLLRRIAKDAPVGEVLPGWQAWHRTGFVAIRRSDGTVTIGARARWLVENLRNRLGSGGDWLPRNERELAGALVRTMPLLADIGIRIVKREPSKNHPYWEFVFETDTNDEV